MEELKKGIGIGLGLLIGYLLYVIFSRFFDSAFFTIVLPIIGVLIFTFVFLEKVENLIDKINFEKVLYKSVGILSLIGLIWLISFAFKRTTYDIRLNAPDSEDITLVVKSNWGLKTKYYNVKFEDYWKYEDKTSDKRKWISLPDKNGIYEDF
jgi:hypothetical protein